jgi:hypothetical protein
LEASGEAGMPVMYFAPKQRDMGRRAHVGQQAGNSMTPPTRLTQSGSGIAARSRA